MKFVYRMWMLCLLMPFFLAGCGGGGGGGNLAGRGPVNIFVTDSFRDDYDHVWVTIHRVDLLDSAGGAAVVFDDGDGKVLDLRTLRDASGERFAFLTNASVPTGSYTGVRITVGQNFSLVPRGSGPAQSVPVVDDVPRDSQGRPTIQFSLRAPRTVGSAQQSVVIDFDLANFVITNGKLRPSIREAISTLLADPSRHDAAHHCGVVSHLAGTAPNQSIVLTTEHGAVLTIQTSAETSIYNADGQPNATLANGQHVCVRGSFDTGSHRIHAHEIAIHGGDAHHRALVIGAPAEVNSGAGRFAVRLGRVEGFHPRHNIVNVATHAETIFRSSSGVVITREEFFAALPSSPQVKAEGTYDEGSNTLNAMAAMLHGEPHERRVRAAGRPDEIRADAGTFVINPLAEWEGFHPQGHLVRVTTSGATVFKDREGHIITAAQFFEQLRAAAKVRVEGIYHAATNTIAARVARILELEHATRIVSAAGPPANVHVGEHAFDIHPVDEHSGFSPHDNLVHVVTTSATVFRGPDGARISAEAFFAALPTARRVRVEGLYNEARNTITAAIAALRGHDEAGVMAFGEPREINAEARNFWINPVLESTGFTPHERRVKVVTNHTTVFKDRDGHVIAAADFFHLLTNSPRVRVEGRYESPTNTITAAVAQLRAP